MPTKEQERVAAEILAPPKDLPAVRERRYQVAEILNTNLLGKEARKAYEELYADLGKTLEKAAKTAS